MTSTLETAVGNVITRVLLMERAAVSASTAASKHWYHIEQFVPYWTNRPTGLVSPAESVWELSIAMRLIVADISQANIGTTPPQAAVWGYIPAVIDYFMERPQLDMTGQTAISYLDPRGLTISCPRGMDVFDLPALNFTAFYVDFDLMVPLVIY